MLFSTQVHMCNIGIKAALLGPEKGLKLKNPKTGMIHLIKSADDIIEYNEASMTPLIEQNKINPETPEHRAKENAEIIKKCKEKSERRKYQKLTGDIAGFENA